MRKILFILSILWIAVGLFCFPFIYFIGAFSTDNADNLQHLLVVCVLLFYFQLIIQSVLALISLKRIKSLRQYLSAILLILVSFLVLLPLGLSIGRRLNSELILQVALYGTFLFQLAGSLWMWVIIGKRSKQPLITQPTITRQVSGGSDEPIASSTPQQISLTGSFQKSRRKLGIAILLMPVLLFILGVVLTGIATKVNPEYYTLHLSTPFPIGKIADATAGLSGMLIIPCVIVGAILLAKK